jgi:hypothetical protein
MTEESGSGARSVPLTNGFGSRRPKNESGSTTLLIAISVRHFVPKSYFGFYNKRFCSESDGSLLKIQWAF